MSATMQRMEPQHAQIKVPPDYHAVFVTPDGRQVYERTSQRAKAVPRLDQGGNRMYRRNQVTGEPMYPLNRPEIYAHRELVTFESEGNWNVRKIPYVPLTPEQIAEQERQQKVIAMQDALPRLLVDEGFTADELLAALRHGRRASEPEAVEPEPVTVTDAALASPPAVASPFPMSQGKGMWILSDGRRVKKTREQAFAMEAALREHAMQAARDALAVPEY